MGSGRPTPASKTQVLVVTADAGLDEMARATFGASPQIELAVVGGSLAMVEEGLDVDNATVVVVDIDATADHEMAALQRLLARVGHWPPVLVVTQAFDAHVARALMQMRVTDFLVKPVSATDLVQACARVAKGTPSGETKEAQIYTFLPAVGGAGVTTLAIQTAMLLLNSDRRGRPTCCLVDLDFQLGAVADYLDVEPRLNLSEIEPRPDRLDRQLLEVMISHHSSGLALIAAPNRPAEMRSFDPDMVTRLLDLVSTQFDYVVFDMPRTWFSWTDSVLLGSNNLYIVCEATVPGLRHAKGLANAIRERLGDGPQPRVIVNRFEPKMFSSGLRKSDVEQALGDDFATGIPNNYQLVREAIDRGVPLDQVKANNKITAALKKLVVPYAAKAAAPQGSPLLKKLIPSLAR